MPRIRLGRLAQNTLGVIGWYAVRVGSQLVWVILLARALGAGGYGEFSGIAGLAFVIGGFSGIGLGLRMYQDTARDHEQFHHRWAQAIRALLLSAAPVGAVFFILAHWFFSVLDWSLLVALALAEIVFAPMVALTASAYAAHDRMQRAAAVPVIASIAKLLAALQFSLFLPGAGPGEYAWLHLLMTAISSIGIMALCRYELKIQPLKTKISWLDVRSGLSLSSIWASQCAMSSLDKAFALRWGGHEVAGNYSTAQRLASVATIPVEALLFSAMPRLFRVGSGKIKNPRMVSMLFLASLGYGVFAGALLWWRPETIAWLLGPDFQGTIPAVRILAFYVPVYCVRILAAQLLLSINKLQWRITTEALGLGTLSILMAWLTPLNGILGAAQALLTTEIILAILLWAGVFKHRHHVQKIT